MITGESALDKVLELGERITRLKDRVEELEREAKEHKLEIIEAHRLIGLIGVP